MGGRVLLLLNLTILEKIALTKKEQGFKGMRADESAQNSQICK